MVNGDDEKPTRSLQKKKPNKDQHNKHHGETQIQKRLPRKQKIIYSDILKSRGRNIYMSKKPYLATITPPKS